MKKLLLILTAVLWGIFSPAQTEVVYFPLANNLNYQAPPTPPALTTVTYHYSNGNVRIPAFENSWLRGVGGGDYLELSINASTLSNLAVFFDARFSAGIGVGTWNVFANTGLSNTFEQVGRITLGSIFGSTSNGSLLESLPPSADGKSDLKIRIQVDFGWNIGDNLRIRNLKLLSGNPKIKMYSDTNTEIPNNANAAENLNTVYGNIQTLLAPGESKTYRIRNWNGTVGSSLNVSNIEIDPASGTTLSDFVVQSTSNITNLPPVNSFQYCSDPRWWGCNEYSDTQFGAITIQFVPQAEGVRTATIKVYSNGTPSPYSFTIIGGGRSCNVSPTTHVNNSADISTQSLPSDLTSDDFVGGTSNAPTPAIFTTFYPTPYNLYTSSPASWYTKEVTKTREFGGASGVDISNLKKVSIEFNVAAFANSNGSNNNTKGVTSTDYIVLSVLNNSTWYDLMQLNGSDSNNNNQRRKYAFNAGGKLFTKNYNLTKSTEENSGNNTGSNGNNGNAFSRFKLNIPLSVSSLITNFKFRIRVKANNDAVWLIDDVKIMSDNAIYKTFTTGNVWSPSPPTPDEKAVIKGNYTNAGDQTVCECEVEPTGVLTIPGSTSLTVRGKVTNDGTFTLQSDANLLQLESGAQNTGNITVERSVTDMDNITAKMDYVYWSSPVADQNLHAFSPGTPAANFLQYKEATDYFVTTYDGVFHPAKGYAIRAETAGVNTPSYDKTYQFVGVPNNGDYPITITRSQNTGATVHGYNLVGNPYPSNIDFDKLYDGNSAKIFKTAWFWTNDFDNPAQQGSEYDGTNYVVYNGTGGSTPAANGIIKVGQGFLVQNKGPENSSVSLNFQNSYGKNNVLRVNTPGRFYQKESSARNRFWLKLISPDDMVNTQLIGYIDGATDGFEQDYDAEIMGMSSDIFYSKLEEKRLLIQGKGAFQTTDKVDLGANFFKAGTYTLALDTAEGIFDGSQKIYLRDKETSTLTDLSVNPYIFEAAKGISEGRFEVIYEPQQVVLGAEEILGETMIVYRDGGDFIVHAQSKNITDLEVYDGSGRLIYKTQPRHTEVRIPGDKLLRGVYILKIDQNGQLTKKKILK